MKWRKDIGLYITITKQVVELMHGYIGVEYRLFYILSGVIKLDYANKKTGNIANK